MKITVKRWSNVPAGSVWHCKHPVTGYEFHGRNRDVLLQDVKQYLLANNMPIGLEWEDQVEQWVCEAMPNECVGTVAGKAIKVRPLSLSDVERGSRVMLKHYVTGSKLVEPAEAKRRADICAVCKMNVTFSKPCGGLCGWLKTYVMKLVPKGGVDARLNSCSICKCWLAAATWLPLTTQCVGVTDDMKVSFASVKNCWKQC